MGALRRVSHGNLSQAAARVSLHAILTLRSIPLVSRAPARVLPDAPCGLIKLQRRLQQLRVSWYLRVTLVYRSHKTACDYYCSIVDQMDRHERDFIDTGKATST